MDQWRRWETQAIRESRGRPGVSKQQSRRSERGSRPAPRVEPTLPAAEPDRTEPGTVLVPIDAWSRVLDQLGNLHEAGQQLAEAKERAARAETESQFLRERLAELRAAAPLDTPVAVTQDTGTPTTAGGQPQRRRRLDVIRSAYRDLRQPRR